MKRMKRVLREPELVEGVVEPPQLYTVAVQPMLSQLLGLLVFTPGSKVELIGLRPDRAVGPKGLLRDRTLAL